jgi:hypothetical protein
MTNPDTDKYAELRTRAENIRDDIEVAQTREVSTFLEDACDTIIRDLLAALAEMQGVVERTEGLFDLFRVGLGHQPVRDVPNSYVLTLCFEDTDGLFDRNSKPTPLEVVAALAARKGE